MPRSWQPGVPFISLIGRDLQRLGQTCPEGGSLHVFPPDRTLLFCGTGDLHPSALCGPATRADPHDELAIERLKERSCAIGKWSISESASTAVDRVLRIGPCIAV